jgi:protein-L-isoaspartate(D-aspartate) O-methyltransferase
MNDPIGAARLAYAEELRSLTHMASPALFAAFATVPRERFLGPGPWRMLDEDGQWMTVDAEPQRVYRNSLITLDEAKGINNGQPRMWAHFLDELGVCPGDHVLHIGCGTGYYTAILAELTGHAGRVTAIEIDAELAERARLALDPWPQVVVIHGDGSRGSFEPADVIVVSAGATQPLPAWMAALKLGGRLMFPLSPKIGPGAMAILTRRTPNNFSARLHYGTYFIALSGADDPEINARLYRALSRDRGEQVKSLRCDPHNEDETCWLRGDGWCFSAREPMQPAAQT